ncbi:MAG: hypothetical protein EA350_15750 [Gemmatimonadales bacterium]|nr:MAG: hypothetical protein EA350_15750 [Gemmatimonadales bacterium]
MILSDPKARQHPGAPAARAAPAPDPVSDRSWALMAVTAFFLVGGVLAAMNFGSGGIRHARLGLGILGLPIGIGLLRRRPGWRTVALVMTGVNALGALAVAFVSLAGVGQFTIRGPGGDSWVPSEPWIGFAFLATLAALSGWMMYVLLRPDTRRRFQDHRPDRPWIEWTALAALLVVAYLVF